MKGDNVGELAVHVEFGSELLPTPIWTKVGDDGNGWTNVRINIRLFFLYDDEDSDVRVIQKKLFL